MNSEGKWDLIILRDSGFFYFVLLSFSSYRFHLIAQDADQLQPSHLHYSHEKRKSFEEGIHLPFVLNMLP